MEIPIDIGRKSFRGIANEYARTWQDVLSASQRSVLAEEIAELLEAVAARAIVRWRGNRGE